MRYTVFWRASPSLSGYFLSHISKKSKGRLLVKKRFTLLQLAPGMWLVQEVLNGQSTRNTHNTFLWLSLSYVFRLVWMVEGSIYAF